MGSSRVPAELWLRRPLVMSQRAGADHRLGDPGMARHPPPARQQPLPPTQRLHPSPWPPFWSRFQLASVWNAVIVLLYFLNEILHSLLFYEKQRTL